MMRWRTAREENLHGDFFSSQKLVVGGVEAAADDECRAKERETSTWEEERDLSERTAHERREGLYVNMRNDEDSSETKRIMEREVKK